MSNFRDEFPDYPADGIPQDMPAGFVDNSWHHDACPCFFDEARRLSIYIDHPDPARREFSGAARFSLFTTDQSGGPETLILETEDWDAVKQAIAARAPGTTGSQS